MPVEYAHALVDALTNASTKKEQEAYVERFIAVLKEHGKSKALPAILRELERIEESADRSKPLLTIAHTKEEESARAQLQSMLPDANPEHIATDETLIGGWRYSAGDTLVDSSHKHALLKLYRRIINV